MPLTAKDKKHINLVLAKLQEIYADDNRLANLNNIFLYDFELMLANPKWEYYVLNKALNDLHFAGKTFNYKNVEGAYPDAKKSLTFIDNTTNRPFTFYILVNHPIPEKTVLLGNTVEIINDTEKNDFLFEFAGIHSQYANNTAALDERKANGYRFIAFHMIARSRDEAFSKFDDCLSLVKGILDFSFTRNMFMFSDYSMRSRTMSRFSIPEFVVTLEKGNHLYQRLQTELPVKPFSEIQTSLPDIAVLLFNLFKKESPEKSIIFLLQKSFSLYNKAMDTMYRYTSFQFFWNILEEITLSMDSGGKTDEVIRKLQNFYTPDFFEMHRHLLDNLKTTRNHLVHRGIDRINDVHINFLKKICEICMESLIENRIPINTIYKLRIAYRNKHVSKKQLEEEMYMIQYKLNGIKALQDSNPTKKQKAKTLKKK